MTLSKAIPPSCGMPLSESVNLTSGNGELARFVILLAKAYISSQSTEGVLVVPSLNPASINGIGNAERRIIEELEKNGPLGPLAISRKLELSRSTTTRALANLLHAHRIVAQGKTRRRSYEVIASPMAVRAA